MVHLDRSKPKPECPTDRVERGSLQPRSARRFEPRFGPLLETPG